MGKYEAGQPIPRERLKEIDALYLDPRERAQWVHGILLSVLEEKGIEISKIDLLCFATEYINQMTMVIDNDDFTRRAKDLSWFVYSLHYSSPEEIYGAPDRPDASTDPSNPTKEVETMVEIQGEGEGRGDPSHGDSRCEGDVGLHLMRSDEAEG